jgi:hypothetical protein
MKVGSFRRYSKEDYKELPPWGEQFFTQLNKVLETHNNALSNGLNFADNFRSEVRTLQIPHDTAFQIQLQELSRAPIGAFVLFSDFFEYSKFTWRQTPDTALSVEVKIKWDSTPTKDPTVTLVFIGR